jgi:predicted RNA-binding Zn ribbon-like protein
MSKNKSDRKIFVEEIAERVCRLAGCGSIFKPTSRNRFYCCMAHAGRGQRERRNARNAERRATENQ